MEHQRTKEAKTISGKITAEINVSTLHDHKASSLKGLKRSKKRNNIQKITKETR